MPDTTEHELDPSSRGRRWRRIGVAGVVLLVAGLALKAVGDYWLAGQRVQLERALARASGYDVRIGGPISVTFFPGPGFALREVQLTRAGTPVLKMKEFQSSFELLPLLAGKYIPHAIHLYGVDLRLGEGAGGIPMSPPIQMPSGTVPSTGTKTPSMRYELPDTIEVHDSDITVANGNGKELYAVHGLNLAIHALRNKAALTQGSSGDWELAIYANLRQAAIGPVVVGPSTLTARATPTQIDIKIEQALVFDGKASGTVSWSDTGAQDRFTTKLSVRNLDGGQAIRAFQAQSFIDGRLDLDASVSTQGASAKALLRNASGNFKFSGTNLQLITVDLDELVARIIKSQQYNLVDAAAYFFLGPLGASVSKGLDVAALFRELGKGGAATNRILRMTSSWKLENGIVSASDVALETNRYRLALQGNVNLLKNEFDNVRIAVVDDRGCAIASQRLDGPIASPRVEKVNMVISVTQPMLDALGKSAKGLIGGQCDAFYKGELLPAPVTATPTTEKPAGKTGAVESAPQSR